MILWKVKVNWCEKDQTPERFSQTAAAVAAALALLLLLLLAKPLFFPSNAKDLIDEELKKGKIGTLGKEEEN